MTQVLRSRGSEGNPYRAAFLFALWFLASNVACHSIGVPRIVEDGFGPFAVPAVILTEVFFAWLGAKAARRLWGLETLRPEGRLALRSAATVLLFVVGVNVLLAAGLALALVAD